MFITKPEMTMWRSLEPTLLSADINDNVAALEPTLLSADINDNVAVPGADTTQCRYK